MRRAARVDANQAEIIAAFRSMGALVIDTSAMGKGYPDLNIVYKGKIIYVEVKDGSKPPSARKLTEQQKDFHAQCLTRNVVINVIESINDAIVLVDFWENFK